MQLVVALLGVFSSLFLAFIISASEMKWTFRQFSPDDALNLADLTHWI